jgi:hypothetical protein
MILNPGDNLLIVHRRLFERDQSRFFIGVVEAYQDGMARVSGYSFARDNRGENFCRKPERYTKLVAIASGTLMTYLVPAELAIDRVRMESKDAGLCLTDGASFSMNISEWIHATPSQR